MPASEQRRFHRYAVSVPCFVRRSRPAKPSKQDPVSGVTRDISRGGICFVANAKWKVGTEIDCVIQLPLQSYGQEPVEIQCSGKIVRVVPWERGGIEVGASIDHFSYLDPGGQFAQIAPF